MRRIHRLLDAAQRDQHSVVIEAPAGFGKTTVVTGWLRDRRIDAHVFTAAIPENPPAEGWLVIDDAHRIGRADRQRLLQLLQTRPVVVLSRRRLPVPLARLEMHGQLSRIGRDDLRLISDEIHAHVGSVAQFSLSTPDRDLIERQTGGWPVAIHRLAVALRDDANVPACLASLQEDLAAYLEEEVVAQLPRPVGRMAALLSVLEFFDPDVAGRLWSEQTGPELLERLRADWLWVDSADAYLELPPLLRMHLRLRLTRMLGPEDRRKVHRIAAGWAAEHELKGETIQHALDAGDFALAARYMGDYALEALWESGRSADVLSWLDQIDEEGRLGHIELVMAEGWARFATGDIADLPNVLTAAQNRFEGDPSVTAEQRGMLTTLLAWVTFAAGDPERALIQFQRALEVAPPTAHRNHLYAYQGMGYINRLQGRVEVAEPVLRKSVVAATAANLDSGLLFASYDLVEVLRMRADLPAMGAVLDETRSELKPETQRLPTFALWWLARAEWHLVRGDLEDCSAALTNAHLVSGPEGYFGTDTLVFCLAAELALGQGALEQAAGLVTRARGTLGPSYAGWVSNQVDIVENRIVLASDDPRRLEAMAAALSPQASLPPYQSHLRAVARGRALARLDPTAASAELEGLATDAAAGGWTRSAIEIHLALSQLFDDAAPVLAALRLAAPGRCTWPFLLEAQLGPAVLPEDLRAFQAELRAQQAAHPATPIVFEALSDRELQVLHFLDRGLSNREIGRRLFIAVGTVSKHTNNIYRKLQVRNRVEALHRARAVGLL